MTLNEVKELIELVAAKGFAEFEIAHSDFKLKIVAKGAASSAGTPAAAQSVAAAPVAAVSATPATPVVAPAPEPHATAAADEDLFVIKSPIVGTFYRSPEPGAKAFVETGQQVKKGHVLCIIEAMKLMNEIESDADGTIVRIYPQNGQPIEYGESLFAVRI